jgi:hypothetical protein
LFDSSQINPGGKTGVGTKKNVFTGFGQTGTDPGGIVLGYPAFNKTGFKTGRKTIEHYRGTKTNTNYIKIGIGGGQL